MESFQSDAVTRQLAKLQERRIFILKGFSGLAGLLIFASAIQSLWGGQLQHQIEVITAFYLCIFGSLIAVGEFSQSLYYLVIIRLLPFIENHTHRGVFYLLISVFCFDPSFGSLTQLSGLVLALCGLAYIIINRREQNPQQLQGGLSYK